MKIFRTLSKFGLGALFLLAAITELVPPHAGPAASVEPPPTRALVIKTALLTLLAAGLLFVLGNLLFIETGWYNLAADTPHVTPVRWTLQTMRDRAVRFHSRGIAVSYLLQGGIAESIALVHIARIKSFLKPIHSLLRSTVSK